MRPTKGSSTGQRGGICFVAPFTYPVLAGDRSAPIIGGAEVQQALLARGLAARGHRVTMVSMDFGQPGIIEVDGVTVYRSHKPMAGLPVLRFFHPRLSSLWRAMALADADVYYQRGCGGALTGQVVGFARLKGRASLFAAASDADFDPALKTVRYARDRALFRWGIRRASAIVVQNATQVADCRATVGREATQITNCTSPANITADHQGWVLWVGHVRVHKAPLDVIAIAQRCPELRFRVVGDGDASLMAELHAAAARTHNIEVVGFVAQVDIGTQFDGAFALINTSPVEGFPNTFLQAWSRAIPTISYVGPAAFIDGRRVDLIAPSLEDLAQRLRDWRASAGEWQQAGSTARRYADENLSIELAAKRYESVLQCIAPAMFNDRPDSHAQPSAPGVQ